MYVTIFSLKKFTRVKKVKDETIVTTCNTFANMAEHRVMEVDMELDDILRYGCLAALMDDDMDDMEFNHPDEEAFHYQRPRSCCVRPWLLRRYEERPPTLYGLIQEIEAVSI